MIEVSTQDLYLKYEELQKLQEIADQAAMAFALPCEVSTEELQLASDVVAHINEYRSELIQRADWLNRTISLRLEKQIAEIPDATT
jgi:uncharacterized protein (UPF0264 family)